MPSRASGRPGGGAGAGVNDVQHRAGGRRLVDAWRKLGLSTDGTILVEAAPGWL